MVKNTKEWLESRKKLKEHKERAAKDGRASNEPAVSGFPRGAFKEQVARGRRAAAQRFKG